MKKVCGAKLRGKPGRTCQKPPMANGRCRLHGGRTPSGPDSPHFKHGKFAYAFKGRMAEKFQSALLDTQPLELMAELAVQRSVLDQYLEQATGRQRLTAADAERISSLTQDVVRTAATIAKMRNDEALTATEIKFLQVGMMRLLEKYVIDSNARRNFIRELAGLIPRRIDIRTDEPASLPSGAGETG